ncbi:MAG: hypothetical protein SFY92_10950 [Verrucomicrobiae bacterium]|nr:hypothetical protein [Verrucomicrobiae bacterium]
MTLPFARLFTDDALSPLLVKELRHNLRTRAFLSFFIISQVLLVIFVLISLMAMIDGRSGGRDSDGFFYFMEGLVFLCIIPLSALGAVSSEIRANTLEPIFLTHLSAWRIVWGKWAAYMAQGFLFLCAILPYVVLRYFLGGVNVLDDLLVLANMYLASSVLIAAAVCLSAFNLRFLLPVLVILLIFGAGGIIPAILYSLTGSRSGTSVGGSLWVTLLPLYLALPLLISGFLAAGASKIAPLAENYSTLKRLSCLGLFVPVLVTLWAKGSPETAFVLALMILVLSCLDALNEETRLMHTVYTPFARWGWPGRLAGLFLYPGWVSGVLYTVACCSLILCFISLNYGIKMTHWLAILSLAGTLLFPLAVIKLFVPRWKRTLPFYISIQVGVASLTAVVGIADGILSGSFKELFSFFPLTCLIFSASNTFDEDEALGWTLVQCGVLFLILTVLFIRMLPVLALIRQLEKGPLPEPPAPTPPPLPPGLK